MFLDLSYPAEVLIFLDKLGEKWEGFACFIGFTNDEIDDVKYHSFGNTKQEIKHFSKIWRMPDMKKKNGDILHRVMNAAKINLGNFTRPCTVTCATLYFSMLALPVPESSPAAVASIPQVAPQGSPMVIKVL